MGRIFLVLAIISGVVYSLPARGGEEGNISLSLAGVIRERLDFGALRVMTEGGKPQSAYSWQRVRLTITNPSGLPFKVTQRLHRPWWVDGRGGKLGGEKLASLAFGQRTSGTLHIPSLTPLGPGEQVIFISNPAGENDSFYIEYYLSLPGGAISGQYRTEIIYTVTILREGG